MDKLSLTVLDWIIIIGYSLGMIGVGIYFSRKNRSADDYMMGGRGMSPWKVALSLFATMFSAVSYLMIPGEIIKHGPMVLLMLTTLPLSYYVVAYFFIPFIMKLKVSSAYELLETRLGLKNRLLASSYFLIMRVLWMSVVIYMVAEKVIIPIMGWSHQDAFAIGLVMGIITIIYTSIGGLRGVVLTDVIQSFVLFGGSLLIIILIIQDLGSVSAIIPTEWPDQWAGWVFFDTNVRMSFVTVFVSTFAWYIFTAGSDQMTVQRYLATKDVKSARKMYLNHLWVLFVVDIILAIIGVGLFSYAQMNPEFLGVGQIISGAADTLFPKFIATRVPVGLSGLIIAGILAAAMSSLSSGINSSSLSIVNDFILRLGNKIMSESQKIKLATIISFAIGGVVVAASLAIGNIKGNLFELTYKTVNLFTAPLFVPFFMAMFVSWATSTGTFIGSIASGITAILIGFSYELFIFTIPFLWIMPVSFVVGVIVSLGLSLPSYLRNRKDGFSNQS